MKTLRIENISFTEKFPDLNIISERFDILGIKHAIAEVNWEEFTYRPEVNFAVGYTDNEILIKYYVTEEWFRAEKTLSNQEVYEDSCVEFFISPITGDSFYYHFEFNGIGTCLMGMGTNRNNIRRADPGTIARIRRLSSAGKKPVEEIQGKFSWSIVLAIPFEIFPYPDLNNLKGKSLRANFYKCGDKLRIPHFLSWNPVRTPEPDFHQPEYFGLLKFI
jgi:hypothetical protein